MRRRLLLRLALALALALGTSGCGKVREVSLCHGVARDINDAVDEIEALSKANPVNELRIADRYGRLAKALEPRSQGEQPLAVAVRDHIAVLRATENAVRSHDTLQKTQPARVTEPRRELERLVKRERSTSARIEVACHH
jgi:hypothetical protein